jgi:putative ATP-dependent endonuclease of OLD family
MKISKIIIKNFRSIVDISIDFEKERNIYALIGANNAGKTNILDAIGLVLDADKFYKYEFEDTDFYNKDTNSQIEIIAELVEPLEYTNVYKKEYKINKFTLRVRKYVRGDQKGIIHTEYYCAGIDSSGMQSDPLLDSDQIQGQKSPLRAKEHIYKLGDIYYLEPHRIINFFKVTGWGPLGRLFKVYREDFLKTNTTYNGIPCKQAFFTNAEELKRILRTEKLKEIEARLLSNLRTYLGLEQGTDFNINLGYPSPEIFMEKLIELSIKENKALEDIDIVKLGSGYLSLFRIAALQALAETKEKKDNIFLIEEPEAYLHPHLRRFFYKVLKKLAENGNQIIYTTHSPEFVELEDYKSIIKVFKENNISSKNKQISQRTQLSFDAIERKLKGNEEIYFSNFAILMEGQNDSVTLKILFEKNNLELDSKSISIINCNGKGNLKSYIDLCNELEINYFVIFDYDKGNAQSMSDTPNILKKLKDKQNQHFMFEKSLESELGLGKNCRTEDVIATLEPLNYGDITKKYPKLIEAFDKNFTYLKSKGFFN